MDALSTPPCPSLPGTVPWIHLVPHHVSAIFIFFDFGHFSTFSCGESGLPVLSSFLGYLYWYRWYLIVSLGQGKLSILLLCHLPRKSQYFLYSSDNYPEREELAHVVILFLMFLEVSIQFSTVTAPIYNLTNSVQRFLFLCIFSSTCYFLSFDNNHSNRYEMIINFHLTISIIDHLFVCLLAICMLPLVDLSVQIIFFF